MQESVALGTYQSVEATQDSRITFEDDEVSIDGSYDGESFNALPKKGANKNEISPWQKSDSSRTWRGEACNKINEGNCKERESKN